MRSRQVALDKIQMAVLLLLMVVSLFLPGAVVYAEGASEGLCVHHSSHTAECGFGASSDGSTEALCAYAENGCPYCIDSWEWVDEQGALSETDGGWTMGLPGVNQDNPITRDSLAELLPGQISATTDDGVKRTLDIAWDLTPVPEEGATEGEYRVTAALADAQYALADDTASLAVTLQLGGAADYTLKMPFGAPPYPEHIVDGVSPSGTTINLFDYWITGQNDSDSSDPADILNSGINKDHALLFFVNGRGNWNSWTGQGGAPYKGIVKDELVNGYPVLNLNTDGTQVAGRDGKESLAYLFDPSIERDGKASYKDAQGLLQVDDDGYYYYDSQKNYAAYYADTNSFTLYKYPGVIPGGTSPVGQFFPFNAANADAVSKSHKGENYTLMNTLGSKDQSINHYFGVHMSTRFIQQFGGHTDSDKTQAVTYEFSGDDDAWIFIDGKLVGDLGGVHDAASVKIDFSTGKVTITSAIGQTKEKSTTLELKELLGLSGDTLEDNTYHTLDFFYLERGNVDSNMYLKYNLVTIPESGLIKVDQVGNRVYGAEFALYSAKDYADKGENATPVATGTTDSNGSFTFTTEDASGGERPVTVSELYDKYKDSKDEGNNLVLVETKTPPGYRTCGEIGLYFYVPSYGSKEVLLLSSNDSIWNKGAYAMPKVYTTTGNTISIVKDSSTAETAEVHLVGDDAVNNPKMFAVVFQKQDNGTWLPVSGDPIKGWKVEKDNTWNSVLNAAKSSPHLFQLSSSGAYQVEIDDLPGDIRTYYYICKNKDEAKYAVGYYYTEADILSDATEANTWRIDSESSKYGLERVFSMSLYVTNMKNRLLVQKVDDKGNPVNGAQFSLYKASDVTVTENADGTSVGPNKTATPAVVTTTDIAKPVKLNGGAVFPDNVVGGVVLENGEYWLFETSVPVGYKVETEPIHVVVDNTGVYADAGKRDDGVTVLRGVGSVARSMVQFAADDGVDITLRDIKAALANRVTFGSYNEDGSFTVSGEGIDWDSSTGEDVLHLQYANANAMLDYGLYKAADEAKPVSIDDLTLATDAGWSMLLIKQCYQHDGQTDVSLKSNLYDVEGKDYSDITSLFSGTVTVRVANERTGNLKISKTVVGEDAPQDSEFSFTVNVTDGTAPLSGAYDTTGSNGNPGKITFSNGTATVTLKANESLTILGLPTGAVWTVVEESADGYVTSVSVSNDETSSTSGSEASGTIGHTPDGADPIKVSYTNVWSGLSVSKTVTGSMGDRDREFSFTIKLRDKDGKPLTGSYSYVGGTLSGTTGVDAPSNGTLMLANGEATFPLKHGQVITIYGLPQGCSYTITEDIDSGEGYKTTVQTGSDEVKNDTTATGTLTGSVSVAFTNALSSAPVTGVSIDTLPWIAASGLTAAGGAALLLSARKHRAGRHFARGKGRGSRR